MNLTKEAIEALFSCGFTAQELYDKGLLVPAGGQSAASDQSATGNQSDSGDQSAAGDQSVQNADSADAHGVDPAEAAGESAQIKAMLDAFREEIKGMIQASNLKDATRDGSSGTQLTLEDAIMSITKGG